MTKLTGIMLVLSSLPFWGLVISRATNKSSLIGSEQWTTDTVLMTAGAFLLPLLGFWLLTI